MLPNSCLKLINLGLKFFQKPQSFYRPLPAIPSGHFGIKSMTKCLTIQSLLVPRSSIRSFSRFQIDDVGEEYCHFSIHYDEEYFKMLTTEHCVTRFHNGVARREWVLKKGKKEMKH